MAAKRQCFKASFENEAFLFVPLFESQTASQTEILGKPIFSESVLPVASVRDVDEQQVIMPECRLCQQIKD